MPGIKPPIWFMPGRIFPHPFSEPMVNAPARICGTPIA
jgi:hypothetical protein